VYEAASKHVAAAAMKKSAAISNIILSASIMAHPASDISHLRWRAGGWQHLRWRSAGNKEKRSAAAAASFSAYHCGARSESAQLG
jgi:hypothetical protein